MHARLNFVVFFAIYLISFCKKYDIVIGFPITLWFFHIFHNYCIRTLDWISQTIRILFQQRFWESVILKGPKSIKVHKSDAISVTIFSFTMISDIENNENENYTAKFAQVAAGLLSACCGMPSTGRMSDAFARHVAACRHMPATDCLQIWCKLLWQNCSSAVGNKPAASCCHRTAAMMLWTELQQDVVNKS